MSECDDGLPQFCCMKDMVIFCMSHDVSQQLVKRNCSTNKTLTVRNRAGYMQHTPESFVKVGASGWMCNSVDYCLNRDLCWPM